MDLEEPLPKRFGASLALQSLGGMIWSWELE